ncbi:hypothetical protein Btru_074239 [Bulinus truncatus]|nr:hypothetical protein Btru_074239 [Bulinus truncatus]
MSSFQQHQNILMNNFLEISPQENIRFGVVSCCPRDSSFCAPPHGNQTWVISGSTKPLGECSMFEHPYFSPSYIQMPTQYSSALPQWRNARITKDNLSIWANCGIFHDRAFGEWHNVFGPRYFYGDNRRL